MAPTKCCCCFRLRLGTLWVAWVNLASCLFSFVVFSLLLFTGDDATDERNNWYEQSREGVVGCFALQALWLVAVLALLVGVYSDRRPAWMLPWVGVTVLNVVLFVALGVYDVTLGNNAPLVAAMLGGVFALYCAHVVYCYYMEVTAGKTSEVALTDSDVI